MEGGEVMASELTEANSCDDLFDAVCELLHSGHRMGSHTPEQTLNRLFRKHLKGHKPDIANDSPWLSRSNVRVTVETWSKPALRELAPRPGSRPPRYVEFPVVIIRYLGRDCLIDGGSRLHAWFEAGDTGDHPAYVVEVRNGAPGS